MMVDSLGINVYRVFMIVFGIGAMAAGFAGIVNAPGGLADARRGRGDPGRRPSSSSSSAASARFPAPSLGGLIAGEIISLTSMVNPGYAYVMLFAAMTLVLVLRPQGLFGARGRE